MDSQRTHYSHSSPWAQRIQIIECDPNPAFFLPLALRSKPKIFQNMPPKRSSFLLLFLFLFPIAAIFIYSYHYHTSSFFSTQNPNYYQNSNHNFTFTIKVLTYNRLPALRRCLISLSAASYSDDVVHLHIFADHFKSEHNDTTIDEKLKASKKILDFIDKFEWKHGQKVVHYRSQNAGLQAQWIEAWWPSGDNEFAFVVEDDLELSSYWYLFLKKVILKYYYDEEVWRMGVYGVSLQRPRFVAGKHGNKLHVDDETRLFLYQMVGTWGQLLFPRTWKEFRLWFDAHKAKEIKPILQGMVTTGWYKKIGEKIWTPWFIKFIHSRGYYNIYTNFLQERALSTSHRDAGVNYGKTAGPDSKLLTENSLDFDLYKLPPLNQLKWYDFCFSEVFPNRKIINTYSELSTVISSMQKRKPIIFISLYHATEKIARNLICHLERLHVQNFLFVGGNVDLLHDFARRGYQVIDSDKLSSEKSEDNLARELSAKLNVIKICLELRYDCWMMDGNIVPYTDFFSDLPNPEYSFSASKNSELLFVKGSSASLQVWVKNVVPNFHKFVHEGGENFVHFVTEILENDNSAKVLRFDDSKIGEKLRNSDDINVSGIDSGKKFVFWSDMGMDLVQTSLRKLDMWLIDGDLSCVSVVCHG